MPQNAPTPLANDLTKGGSPNHQLPQLSSLTLGTMTFGEQTSPEDAFNQMDAALKHGVTMFDTAELYAIPPRAETYGLSEKIIGQWLKERGRNTGAGREEILIASKVVGRSTNDWYRPASFHRASGTARLDKANITYALENSLKRLGTDYIDLYQLHWPDRAVQMFGAGGTTFQPPAAQPDEVPLAETIAALEELVQAGKIKAWGLSNETPWGVMSAVQVAKHQGALAPATIQNAYSLLNRTYEMGLAEITMREGVGLLAYSPLAQGYLTGKYLDGARPEGARTTRFNRGQRYEKPGTDEAIKAYVTLAKEAGLDVVQMALAFVMRQPFVRSTILGARNLAQLEVELGALNVTLKPDVVKAINAIHQRHQNPAP
ncbi:aldo/keto reductase [Formicincola oecophyllae]|uniref:Aldo/keto reductase n=1 Tax=Formicincola oecophyllae TaxID=2558361 RepID=A0A4Y6UAZ0_9PROT|nr:aldo/keto reductase [Formicincola oecophyllae]QDH13295.1 aldo/keto reductase [Formicincola oecophyllae]